MQIYLDFGFFLSCDILPAEGPLCVVEDEVGVRVRALSDSGRLEQLAVLMSCCIDTMNFFLN